MSKSKKNKPVATGDQAKSNTDLQAEVNSLMVARMDGIDKLIATLREQITQQTALMRDLHTKLAQVDNALAKHTHDAFGRAGPSVQPFITPGV